MFFLGILIGVGVSFIALLIWDKFESIGWSILGIIFLGAYLFDHSSSMTWGMIISIIVMIIIFYNIEKNQSSTTNTYEKQNYNNEASDYYKSHCWNCGNPINGEWNRKCPDCLKYYICPKCGACKCDFGKKPPFKH